MLLSEQAEHAARRAALPRWLMVVGGGERYGVPAARAREIVEDPELIRVPGAGGHVRGLMNLRGRAVTVFDLGHALKGGPEAADAEPGDDAVGPVVVVQDGTRLMGLMVDTVLDVAPVTVDRRDLASPDVLDPATIVGVGRYQDESFIGLSTTALFRSLLD